MPPSGRAIPACQLALVQAAAATRSSLWTYVHRSSIAARHSFAMPPSAPIPKGEGAGGHLPACQLAQLVVSPAPALWAGAGETFVSPKGKAAFAQQGVQAGAQKSTWTSVQNAYQCSKE